MAGNVLGYKVVLVIPDNYSPEKQKLLRLYGAKVVLSDSRLGNNSHGEKCMELQLENPSYVMLNQQRNGANPQTHRDTTAPEILSAFGEQRVDYFVSGIGTGVWEFAQPFGAIAGGAIADMTGSLRFTLVAAGILVLVAGALLTRVRAPRVATG